MMEMKTTFVFIFLSMAFLRFRGRCLCRATVGRECALNAFAETPERMLGSYPLASANILSNIKLFMCQQSAGRIAMPTRAGASASLGWGKARKSPALEVISQKRQLCVGAASRPEGAHPLP